MLLSPRKDGLTSLFKEGFQGLGFLENLGWLTGSPSDTYANAVEHWSSAARSKALTSCILYLIWQSPKQDILDGHLR